MGSPTFSNISGLSSLLGMAGSGLDVSELQGISQIDPELLLQDLSCTPSTFSPVEADDAVDSADSKADANPLGSTSGVRPQNPVTSEKDKGSVSANSWAAKRHLNQQAHQANSLYGRPQNDDVNGINRVHTCTTPQSNQIDSFPDARLPMEAAVHLQPIASESLLRLHLPVEHQPSVHTSVDGNAWSSQNRSSAPLVATTAVLQLSPETQQLQSPTNSNVQVAPLQALLNLIHCPECWDDSSGNLRVSEQKVADLGLALYRVALDGWPFPLHNWPLGTIRSGSMDTRAYLVTTVAPKDRHTNLCGPGAAAKPLQILEGVALVVYYGDWCEFSGPGHTYNGTECKEYHPSRHSTRLDMQPIAAAQIELTHRTAILYGVCTDNGTGCKIQHARLLYAQRPAHWPDNAKVSQADYLVPTGWTLPVDSTPGKVTKVRLKFCEQEPAVWVLSHTKVKPKTAPAWLQLLKHAYNAKSDKPIPPPSPSSDISCQTASSGRAAEDQPEDIRPSQRARSAANAWPAGGCPPFNAHGLHPSMQVQHPMLQQHTFPVSSGPQQQCADGVMQLNYAGQGRSINVPQGIQHPGYYAPAYQSPNATLATDRLGQNVQQQQHNHMVDFSWHDLRHSRYEDNLGVLPSAQFPMTGTHSLPVSSHLEGQPHAGHATQQQPGWVITTSMQAMSSLQAQLPLAADSYGSVQGAAGPWSAAAPYDMNPVGFAAAQHIPAVPTTASGMSTWQTQPWQRHNSRPPFDKQQPAVADSYGMISHLGSPRQPPNPFSYDMLQAPYTSNVDGATWQHAEGTAVAAHLASQSVAPPPDAQLFGNQDMLLDSLALPTSQQLQLESMHDNMAMGAAVPPATYPFLDLQLDDDLSDILNLPSHAVHGQPLSAPPHPHGYDIAPPSNAPTASATTLPGGFRHSFIEADAPRVNEQTETAQQHIVLQSGWQPIAEAPDFMDEASGYQLQSADIKAWRAASSKGAWVSTTEAIPFAPVPEMQSQQLSPGTMMHAALPQSTQAKPVPEAEAFTTATLPAPAMPRLPQARRKASLPVFTYQGSGYAKITASGPTSASKPARLELQGPAQQHMQQVPAITPEPASPNRQSTLASPVAVAGMIAASSTGPIPASDELHMASSADVGPSSSHVSALSMTAPAPDAIQYAAVAAAAPAIPSAPVASMVAARMSASAAPVMAAAPSPIPPAPRAAASIPWRAESLLATDLTLAAPGRKSSVKGSAPQPASSPTQQPLGMSLTEPAREEAKEGAGGRQPRIFGSLVAAIQGFGRSTKPASGHVPPSSSVPAGAQGEVPSTSMEQQQLASVATSLNDKQTPGHRAPALLSQESLQPGAKTHLEELEETSDNAAYHQVLEKGPRRTKKGAVRHAGEPSHQGDLQSAAEVAEAPAAKVALATTEAERAKDRKPAAPWLASLFSSRVSKKKQEVAEPAYDSDLRMGAAQAVGVVQPAAESAVLPAAPSIVVKVLSGPEVAQAAPALPLERELQAAAEQVPSDLVPKPEQAVEKLELGNLLPRQDRRASSGAFAQQSVGKEAAVLARHGANHAAGLLCSHPVEGAQAATSDDDEQEEAAGLAVGALMAAMTLTDDDLQQPTATQPTQSSADSAQPCSDNTPHGSVFSTSDPPSCSGAIQQQEHTGDVGVREPASLQTLPSLVSSTSTAFISSASLLTPTTAAVAAANPASVVLDASNNSHVVASSGSGDAKAATGAASEGHGVEADIGGASVSGGSSLVVTAVDAGIRKVAANTSPEQVGRHPMYTNQMQSCILDDQGLSDELSSALKLTDTSELQAPMLRNSPTSREPASLQSLLSLPASATQQPVESSTDEGRQHQ